MSSTKKILFTITIMLTSIVIMGELALYPIYNEFYGLFPEDEFATNTMISIPQLTYVVASLCTGFLMSKFDKKWLLLIGCVLFMFGGVFTPTILDPVYMITMRAIYGLGMGMVNTVAFACLATVYRDEDKRATIMGWFSAVMAIIGAILGFISGQVAVDSFVNSFMIFWAMVPIAIMVIVFVPKMPAGAEAYEDAEFGEAEGVANQKGYGWKFWTILLIYFFFNLAYAWIMSFNSLYVDEHGFGGPAFAGSITSIGAIGCFLAGLATGIIYKKVGRGTAAVCLGSILIGLLIWFFFVDTTATLVGAFFVGLSYGCFMAFMYTYAPSVLPPSKIDASTGFITTAYGLAMFITSYLITWAMGLVEGSYTGTLLGIIVMIVICLIAELCFEAKARGEKKAVTADVESK